MLRVTVDLEPHGDREAATKIAEVEVVNGIFCCGQGNRHSVDGESQIKSSYSYCGTKR